MRMHHSCVQHVPKNEDKYFIKMNSTLCCSGPAKTRFRAEQTQTQGRGAACRPSAIYGAVINSPVGKTDELGSDESNARRLFKHARNDRGQSNVLNNTWYAESSPHRNRVPAL